MSQTLRGFALAGVLLVAALSGAMISSAWAAITGADRGGLVTSFGWNSCTETRTSIPTTVGGTSVVTTGLADRGRVSIAVDYSETDHLYCSLGGAPLAGAGAGSKWTFSLSGDDAWQDVVDAAVVIKCIADSGSIIAHVTECKR